MDIEKARGSQRLFDMDDDDNSGLADAIGVSRAAYDVKWWWKYGTPAFIDRIKGGLTVKPAEIGQTLEQILKLNTPGVQVSARVFPLGIVNPDAFQVELDFRRAGRG